jgi:hypothetical protein
MIYDAFLRCFLPIERPWFLFMQSAIRVDGDDEYVNAAETLSTL